MKLKDTVALATGGGTGTGKDDTGAMTGHDMIVSCGLHLIHPQELHRL